jgi:hypothetical protein
VNVGAYQDSIRDWSGETGDSLALQLPNEVTCTHKHSRLRFICLKTGVTELGQEIYTISPPRSLDLHL